MSEFFSELKALFARPARGAAEYVAAEILVYVIFGAIWGVGWVCVFLVRNYQRPTGMAAISCGALILALVAWRTIKAIDLVDDRSNPED
jgi:hypothetical protein